MRFPVAWGASPAGHLLLPIYQQREEERQRAVMSPWNATWAPVTNSAGRRTPDHKHRRLRSKRPIEASVQMWITEACLVFWRHGSHGNQMKNVAFSTRKSFIKRSQLEPQCPDHLSVFLWMNGRYEKRKMDMVILVSLVRRRNVN